MESDSDGLGTTHRLDRVIFNVDEKRREVPTPPAADTARKCKSFGRLQCLKSEYIHFRTMPPLIIYRYS